MHSIQLILSFSIPTIRLSHHIRCLFKVHSCFEKKCDCIIFLRHPFCHAVDFDYLPFIASQNGRYVLQWKNGSGHQKRSIKGLVEKVFYPPQHGPQHKNKTCCSGYSYQNNRFIVTQYVVAIHCK